MLLALGLRRLRFGCGWFVAAFEVLLPGCDFLLGVAAVGVTGICDPCFATLLLVAT